MLGAEWCQVNVKGEREREGSGAPPSYVGESESVVEDSRVRVLAGRVGVVNGCNP